MVAGETEDDEVLLLVFVVERLQSGVLRSEAAVVEWLVHASINCAKPESETIIPRGYIPLGRNVYNEDLREREWLLYSCYAKLVC